jgi:DNA repair protein RecO
MLKKEEGVVIRSSRSGSSRIATFLGEESGKIKLIAKAAMKDKSPYRAALEPGTVLQAVYYYKEGRDLFYLKEAEIRIAGASVEDSLPGMASRLAAIELVDQVTYFGHRDEGVFETIVSFLAVQRPQDPLFFFLVLQMKLLGVIGSLPEFGHCSVCGEKLESGVYDPRGGVSFCAGDETRGAEAMPLEADCLSLIETVAVRPFRELSAMRIEESLRKSFGQILHWTYIYHVQGYRLPDSFKLLKQS